ncbi:MAG: BatA domain-containing protein, partial [Verrucomicrobiae bacterium]|nr:BatA domain-containing protein [Verrucomicrobiae bacterium]
MTFLNTSLLILGAALALGPIIIHLLNRRRYRIIDWAAADFLLESFKKTKRRIRLEQLLLLAMRVGGVGMMGSALARPFVPEQSLAALLGTDEAAVRRLRHAFGVRPVYKRVDSCAAEFDTDTAYL